MTYDIYGLGNALVDMEFQIRDDFLEAFHITTGHMTLVDEDRQSELIENLADREAIRASGGSAANTLIGITHLGATGFYSCRVAADEAGQYFIDDLNRAGIDTNSHDQATDGITGKCLVLITPDAERSLNTFLGVSAALDVGDLNESALRASRCLYVEGYLASSPSARAAAIHAHEIAVDSGVTTALTLSDPSMVELFRDELEAMLGNGVDHLFCNEEEALQWCRTDRLDVALSELKDIARSLNITLGAKGSLTFDGHVQHHVSGFEVSAVDTTGAGDIFAGACLWALLKDHELTAAAHFGNYAASQLVTNYGARLSPEGYRELARSYPGQLNL
jgi:sugar/nucleoside kinase (ribokinase family)